MYDRNTYELHTYLNRVYVCREVCPYSLAEFMLIPHWFIMLSCWIGAKGISPGTTGRVSWLHAAIEYVVISGCCPESNPRRSHEDSDLDSAARFGAKQKVQGKVKRHLIGWNEM